MAGYTFGQDILIDVLSWADELGIGSADFELDAKRIIQAKLVELTGNGFPWPWAKKNPPGVLVTLSPITAGTVSVATGSDQIIFSSAPVASIAGRKFYVEKDGTVYRITAHTAGMPNATIDAVYLGTSDPAAAYFVVQDEYDLALDFLRPFEQPFLRDMNGSCHCDLRNEDELAYKHSYPANLDTPIMVCFIGPQKIRLAPTPSTSKKYEYRYLRHPTTHLTNGVLDFTGDPASDALIIEPMEHRIIVAYETLAHVLHGKNDLVRASSYAQAAAELKRTMQQMALKLMHPRLWQRSGNRISAFR